VRHDQCQPHGTVPPTPVRLTRRALEGAGCTLELFPRESAGSDHDVRPAGAPSPPLLVLCGRPRPCSATPGTATTTLALLNTRGRDAATPDTVPRTDHRQRPPRARLKTPQPTTTPSPSKLPLFKYGTRHDDKTRARTARTTANSTGMHAIPPHVAKQCGMLVIHPLLGLYKEGDPPRRGKETSQTENTHTHTLPVIPRYWHSPQSLRLGLGGHASSPALLVAAPLQAPRCKAI
jgi:hypothetical protein